MLWSPKLDYMYVYMIFVMQLFNGLCGFPAAFLGDIALDEEDLRLLKDAQNSDEAQQPDKANSGV